MNAPETTPEFELVTLDAGIAEVRTTQRLQRFDVWLLAAFVIHAVLLTGFISSKPRQLGDEHGAEDAISVSLVTEAELRGDATVADTAAGQPPSPPPPQLRPQITDTATPESPPPPDAVKPEQEPEKAAPPAEPEVAAQPSVEPAPHMSDSQSAKPAEKKAEAEHKAQSKPPQAKPAPPKPKDAKTANLDLAMPSRPFDAPPGSRGAGLERPAGITRSGENDDFARGVVRALQGTMPQLRNTFGRVRVRITLNKSGNIVSTQVVMPSDVAGLDQSVVFATRQTSFPLPPNNAKPADLVFVVTYIYR